MKLEEIEFKVIRSGRLAARYDFGPEINVQVASMLQRMADTQNEEERLYIMHQTMDSLQQEWLSAEAMRIATKRSWLERQRPVVKVRPLNDYLYSNNDHKSSFKAEMLQLLGSRREIHSISPDIDHISHMELNKDRYGALSRTLTVIIRHTKSVYLKRIRDEHAPGGYRPSQERIEFFHRLHLLYRVDETDFTAVGNFDHYVCKIIRKMNS